jgi:glyoxylase-like metal-dependent hydrolase (beta-lactamase superfamily II)
MHATTTPPFTRQLTLEALQQAVRWPNPDRQTLVALVGQFLATHRDQAGFDYFSERARTQPDEPLFQALEGLFQARLTNSQPPIQRLPWLNAAIARLDRAVAQAPGLTTYFRGLVLADAPAPLRQADAAVADLEWVLANRQLFPTGLLRSVYRSLAKAYTTLGRTAQAHTALERSGYRSLSAEEPQFVTDAWMTASDGFRFVLPRLVQKAPGIYVAQGYDFADFAFVLTDDGIVAIDAGSSATHVEAALAQLRQITSLPITHVILTHAHRDHIGGLAALTGPGVQVIASANYADELQVVNATGIHFRFFSDFDSASDSDSDATEKQPLALAPDRLVSAPERLTLGGVDFELVPVSGGETTDGLLIHLPIGGVVFIGDVAMPHLGSPFLPEGSLEGLLKTLSVIQDLRPSLLIHGHPPLTDLFTIDALPGLQAALGELDRFIRQGIRTGQTLVELLYHNCLPTVLEEHPAAVIPFIVMRDNVIKRVYHQQSGYWKSDGEGVEHFAPAEWAAALNLLGGSTEQAFVKSATTLLAQGDATLAHKLVDFGLLCYPSSRPLIDLRCQALDRLREVYQQLNPFKFIVYSEWAAAELRPVA